MSKKHQIGYSLSLWETLKEYNEETKWFEPTKNKKVEVAQMLSDELSDDEEVKSLLIDKLFGYKDNIKEMIMKSDYCEIPSYHKESLEKDQKIADLEAKLEELRKQITICDEENSKTFMKFVDVCRQNAELKQQLAESEIKLNRYPYKNDVIEEEYEDLKDAITFLMLNNIKDQEQLNYSIDVLCEKHKARIRDIENSICKIEQLEQQLAEKDKEYQSFKKIADENVNYLKNRILEETKNHNQDKISFCIEKLEKVKDELTKLEQNYNLNLCDIKIYNFIDNQIKQLKEGNNV